jgi:molybdate transport system substrate-binding protein
VSGGAGSATRGRRPVRRVALARAALARGVVAALLVAGAAPGAAATLRVAVTASFQPALAAVAPRFTTATGHRLLVSAGSTGKLAAQVEQGAPFDVLLAADAERPRLLVSRGHAVAATRFTYARGRLVLWSARPGLRLGPDTLRRGAFGRLAIASPRAAPYGAAALEALGRLGVSPRLGARLVYGESVGQTFSFVASGAADLGFVALSQVVGREDGSRWLVPASLHSPIEHQAVLLSGAREPEAARALLRWLRGSEARAVIAGFGYAPP